MVKLFVGNLADTVDSHRLKNLFLQYVHVQECDVLKNFAFVHVVTDEDADTVIDKLEKYNLEGREIHIERSTSRLRKEPGMSDKCFTCGACDHKTPSCPYEPNKRLKTTKKPEETSDNGFTVGKKARLLSSYLIPSTTQLTIPAAGAPVNGASTVNNFSFPQCWGYKVGGGSDNDPEMPCPQNPELRTLYDQYLESRTRYFFYRERLGKELRLQQDGAGHPAVVAAVAAAATPIINPSPIHLGTIDLTKKTNVATAPSASLAIGGTNASGQSFANSPGQSQFSTNYYSSIVTSNTSLSNSAPISQFPVQAATDLSLHYNTPVVAVSTNSSLNTTPTQQPITRVNLSQSILPQQQHQQHQQQLGAAVNNLSNNARQPQATGLPPPLSSQQPTPLMRTQIVGNTAQFGASLSANASFSQQRIPALMSQQANIMPGHTNSYYSPPTKLQRR